jgi:GAF domain-containing protein
MACRIAVEVGGYQMAWVGYAENDARKSIRPMALVGSAKDDLSRMHLTWADTKFGCGPTGEAIRTGQPCRCQDIAKDLMHAPWRADALKHGYASALALPLMSEQECLGALTIYAAHREAFDEVEVSLLQQLANDLTVGIMSIRARAQRAVLERQVLDISESVQRRIGQDLHDGVGQSIIGIGYLVSAVQQALAGKSAPEAAELEGRAGDARYGARSVPGGPDQWPAHGRPAGTGQAYRGCVRDGLPLQWTVFGQAG